MSILHSVWSVLTELKNAVREFVIFHQESRRALRLGMTTTRMTELFHQALDEDDGSMLVAERYRALLNHEFYGVNTLARRGK